MRLREISTSRSSCASETTQRGHIGQCGGLKHPFGAAQLGGLQKPLLLQRAQRAGGGVKLDRQGHELEDRRQRKEQQPDVAKRLIAQDQPCHKQRDRELGAKVGHWDDRGAQLHGGIFLGVLDCVPAFMSRYPDRRHRAAAINVVRQADHAAARVKMVGEFPRNPFHPDLLEAVCIENPPRNLCGCDPARRADFGILVKRAGNLHLSPAREQQRRDDQNQIIKVKHTAPPCLKF